jgi:guanosine-3',5'-bis(diphosphate) 3'-pyrophosphohydrolase
MILLYQDRSRAKTGSEVPNYGEWSIILRAANVAARWHAHQTKKGGAQEPYINHLLEVAALVAEATRGSDIDLVVAALLHDAIEDQEVPREMIAQEFGEDVVKLVEELADDMTLPDPERRQRQVEHAPMLSDRAKIIKLADKISNLKKVTDPPPDWSVKRRLEYLAWARQVVTGLRGASAQLEDAFDRNAAKAEESLMPHPITGSD